MRILIIRHGDPDYSIDGLTEKGKREVLLLKDRMLKEDITKVYCSIYGRAKLTAKPFLDELKINAEYCDWLKEFNHNKIKVPYSELPIYCWDILPQFLNTVQNIYHPIKWKEVDFIKNSTVPNSYDYVIENFDKMLLSHGYKRNGYNYIAEKSNHDTIVLVCHFGLTAILLSHLLNCSPYSIWQHTFTAPTSITTIYTEERENGIAEFRLNCLGDVNHLIQNGEPVSFSGRFCECFTDDTRH